MFEESHTAFFRLARTTSTPAPTGRWRRLAEGARLAGRIFGEPLLGTLEPGAPADLVVLDYPAPAPLDELELRRALDLRALGPRRPRRDGRGRVGRERPPPDASRPAGSSPPRRSSRPSGSGGGSTRSSRTGSSRREATMAVSSEGRVALYLQDKHPIRDGMRYAQLAEAARLRGGLAGGEPARARGDGADGRLRGRHRADRHRLGRRQQVDAQRAACSPRPSRRSTTSRPAGSSSGSAPGGIRSRRRSASTAATTLEAMRETVEVTRRLLAMERVTFHGEFVHLDDVEIDIVHGDRSPKHVPIYIGATGDEDDGARRRDRRRRAPQLPRRPRVQPQQAMDALAEGAARGGPHASTTSTGRSSSSARSTTTARVALDRARELVTQYLGQQPHIMKASGVDPSLLEEIGADPHLAGDAGADRAARCTSSPTRSCS